jgi:hypothetical protein
MTGSIAGEHSWAYIWDKETKHDHFSGSLAMRAFRRGHLLYHPSPWYEARYLRTRALDHVELHARNVGHNYRGQPGLTTSDPSTLVGFSSFAAALLLLAQLKANFGSTGLRSYEDILDHCCFAWNKLIDMPWKIMSIGTREWAYRSSST